MFMNKIFDSLVHARHNNTHLRYMEGCASVQKTAGAEEMRISESEDI